MERAHTHTHTLTHPRSHPHRHAHPGGLRERPAPTAAPRPDPRRPAVSSVPAVSPPCPRRVPSVSPLSPCRGDVGSLCTQSGVPGVSDARRGAHRPLCPQSSWESVSLCPQRPSVLEIMVFPLSPEVLRVPLSLAVCTVPCVPQSSQKFPHPLRLPRFPGSPVSPYVPGCPHCPLCPQQPHRARGSTQQRGWVWARAGDGFHFGATTEPRDGGAERLR